MSPQYPTVYTYSQLHILWYLKRHGPVRRQDVNHSVYQLLSDELQMKRGTVRYTLRILEEMSLVLRTYEKGAASNFKEGARNPLIRVELVDPDMYLPPCPPPMPLAVVMARENEDLDERTAHEPSAEQIIMALLKRNDELQGQITRLQDIVAAQAETLSETNKLIEKAKTNHHDLGHLHQRVRDALTPEQWESLRHG